MPAILLVLADIAAALAGIVFVVAIILRAFKPKEYKHLEGIVGNWAAAAFRQIVPIVHLLAREVEPLASEIEKEAAAAMTGAHRALEATFGKLAVEAFRVVTESVEGKGASKPDNWKEIAGKAMEDAFGFGLASGGAAAMFEAIFPERLNTLNGVGPMLAQLAGFGEVAHHALGPLLEAAYGRSSLHDANDKFRPNRPGVGEASHLFSSRTIAAEQFRQFCAWQGFPKEIIDKLEVIAFHPVSVRALSRLADDTPIDRNVLVEIMRFEGLREKDIGPMTDALLRAGIKSERQEFLKSAIAAAGKGHIDDVRLQQVLERLHLREDAKDLIFDHVHLDRADRLMEEYAKSWEIQATAGVIRPEAYQAALHALGFTQDEVDARVAIANARSEAKFYTQEQRAAAAEFRKEQRVAIQAAVAAFDRQDINEGELAAALTATGITPVVVAGLVALHKIKSQPKPRRPTTRVTKTPAEKAQQERVKAIEEQFKKSLIEAAELVRQLMANGLTEAEASAELSFLAAAKKQLIPV